VNYFWITILSGKKQKHHSMKINVFLEHGHEKTFKFGQESSISSKTTHHSMKL
jgi:hypothetical protein